MVGTGRGRRIFFLAIVILGSLEVNSHLSAQEDILKIEALAVPRRLARGQDGEVVLKMTIREGVSISPYPDFIIEFQPCPALVFPKNFFTATDLEVEVADKDGEKSLSLDKPLKIPFTVSLDAKRGSYILEGRVKYFARSKKESWCLKGTAKFFVPFGVGAARIKK